MSPRLTLKNDKGWFAAGAEVEKALTILSDGAFKLFIHLCLVVPREKGRIQISQLELARDLGKGTQTIRRHLREMEQAAVCRLSGFAPIPYCRGTIEITDAYWPYHRSNHKPEVDEAADDFVAAIGRLLSERACVRASLSTADVILARQWKAHGIPLEQVEKAILLGCTRKYVSWRNNPGQGPISSLHYFGPLLEEVQPLLISPDYWRYLRSRMERIEKLWIQRHQKTDQPQGQGSLLGSKAESNNEGELGRS